MGTIIDFLNKLEPGNWVSLICGGISIIISILVGSWNFLHTNRQFKAAYYPQLRVDLKDRECDSGICPRLLVRNMSKDKAIVDAKIRLLIKEPSKRKTLSLSKWVELISKDGIEINPGDEYILEDSTDKELKGLEQFLLAKFPKYIHAQQIGKSQFTYYLSNNNPLHFRAIVNFETGITGVGRAVVKEDYHINVKSTQQTGQGYRLSYWKF